MDLKMFEKKPEEEAKKTEEKTVQDEPSISKIKIEPRTGEGFKTAKEKARSAVLDLSGIGEKEGKTECPDCHKWYKHLAKHKCKEAPKKSKLDPDLLLILDKIKGRLGEQSVKVLVHILEYAKQKQTGIEDAKFVCPVGWLKETGELHGMIIEFCLKKYGPEESEIYIIVMSAVTQWYGAIQINFLEQPKQLDSVRSTGIRKDVDSALPDAQRTTSVNP